MNTFHMNTFAFKISMNQNLDPEFILLSVLRNTQTQIFIFQGLNILKNKKNATKIQEVNFSLTY